MSSYHLNRKINQSHEKFLIMVWKNCAKYYAEQDSPLLDSLSVVRVGGTEAGSETAPQAFWACRRLRAGQDF